MQCRSETEFESVREGWDNRSHLLETMNARHSRIMSLFSSVLSTTVLVVLVLACGASKTNTQEFKSGRLKYVETLGYGSVGSHGSQGWYVSDRNLYVNERRWTPDGFKVKDIAGCEPSPNTTVEALKCYSFAESKEAVFVLRMKNDQPEWVTASDAPYGSGDNLGEWAGDGRWLMLKDYYFNVSTSERRAIKGLPEYPGKYFRAASPDLKTVIYEEYCFTIRFDLPTDKARDKEIEKQCNLSNEHNEKGIIAFWLIDVETGDVKILELKKQNFPTLNRSNNRAEREWLENFQKMLVWQKDKNGRDRLAYPKES